MPSDPRTVRFDGDAFAAERPNSTPGTIAADAYMQCMSDVGLVATPTPDAAARHTPDILVCTNTNGWSKELVESSLCVTDNTGTVRVFVQRTDDPVGDMNIAQHVKALFDGASSSRIAALEGALREALGVDAPGLYALGKETASVYANGHDIRAAVSRAADIEKSIRAALASPAGEEGGAANG